MPFISLCLNNFHSVLLLFPMLLQFDFRTGNSQFIDMSAWGRAFVQKYWQPIV